MSYLKFKTYLLMPILTTLIFISCKQNEVPEITADVDGCVNCNMTISKLNQACGYYHEDEFLTFDCPTCLLDSYQTIKKKDGKLPVKIFFADYNSSALTPLNNTTFLFTENVRTVMSSGVICFDNKKSAQAAKKYEDEIITDWIGFQVKAGRPDKTIAINISEERIEPGTIVANKGEIIEFVFNSQGIEVPKTITIKGYERYGFLNIPPGSGETNFRIFTDKPGAGFPFINEEGTVFGILKVTGAHTADEEEM